MPLTDFVLCQGQFSVMMVAGHNKSLFEKSVAYRTASGG